MLVRLDLMEQRHTAVLEVLTRRHDNPDLQSSAGVDGGAYERRAESQ